MARISSRNPSKRSSARADDAVGNPRRSRRGGCQFGSIFSTFLTPEVSEAAKLALFAFVVLESFLWFSFVALVFGMQKPRQVYQKAGRWIDAAAGVLFSFFGVGLIWTNR